MAAPALLSAAESWVCRRRARGWRGGACDPAPAPGTAKGVIFLTLEDETGVVNVIVWRGIYERFRRAVIAGRMLRVTGRLQRDNSVTHVIADEIEDISPMLDRLLAAPETLSQGAETG